MTPRTRRLRRARTAGTPVTFAVIAVLAAATLASVGTATAIPVPIAPTDEAVADQWVNPAIRPADGDKGVTIDLVHGPTTLEVGEDLSLRIIVRNSSTETVEELHITPRRGPITASVADSRVAAVAEPHDYSVVGERVTIARSLAPGGSTELDIKIPTTADTPGALPMSGSAVYPIMLVLSGAGGEHYDSERFQVGTAETTQQGSAERRHAPGVTMLYPITAPVDVVPGETGEAPEDPPLVLKSEQLAEQLAPEGRLSTLLNTYDAAVAGPAGAEVRQATCLAVDPALINSVERMTAGYSVAHARPPVARKPQRLRDSWEDKVEQVPSTPGTGVEDAAAWLDQLRATAADSCVVALPWANSDVNAVAQGGEPWLMREAIERGPFTLERVLQVPTVRNVVLPPSGYVAEGVAPALGWANHEASTVDSTGMSGAWENTQTALDPQDSSVQVEDTPVTNLERDLPPNPTMAAAPDPTTPVRVLVADNSVSRETSGDPATQRFSYLSPGITAVTFQDSLASTLASAGSLPLTTGYSNTDLRYDATKDSTAARDITAANAVRLAIKQSTTTGEQPAVTPVLINPPGSWDARTAREALATVQNMLIDDHATAMTLEDYLTVPAGAHVPRATATGSPYVDPTVFSDAEILSAGQQARYVDDLTSFLVADPVIALTRYGYTAPLRRDLLTALSIAYRRSPEHYSNAVTATRTRLNETRDTLNELRGAVNLIPPGNVFTRTSESSPLFIVAENGLPLPVDATLLYEAPAGTVLDVPEQLRIPARGSITIEMTAAIPDSSERTDMRLYLATPQGQAISAPVAISVRTAATEVGLLTVGGLFILFLALFVLLLRSRRRGKTQPSSASAGFNRGIVRADDQPPD
ncbi:hypothetical protein [Corynebacterium cystitidis]|uniref:hypothetical protein n=1 Tax=Corynebacterium cystitidis TaxID=35757 RepID=UPI00211DDFB0|nr:hypothetical protein [Corynebacterium cystitidis]